MSETTLRKKLIHEVMVMAYEEGIQEGKRQAGKVRDDLAEQFCDKYCRYPLLCKDQDELLNHCEGCPFEDEIGDARIDAEVELMWKMRAEGK